MLYLQSLSYKPRQAYRACNVIGQAVKPVRHSFRLDFEPGMRALTYVGTLFPCLKVTVARLRPSKGSSSVLPPGCFDAGKHRTLAELLIQIQ